MNNLLCDVPDGQEVIVDAVQAEDNTWIVTLVWIGLRPAKPRVGDNENLLTKGNQEERRRPETINNCRHGDTRQCWRRGNTPNVGPGSPLTQPSNTIYKNIKGAIVQVMECIGTSEVQERAVSRKVKFTGEGFYKKGTMFPAYLNEVLREGDTVFLDYNGGVNGRNEEIRCDLVWQGRRPKEIRQMSPEEFRQSLQKDTQDGENVFCVEDIETEAERGVT
ncbi:hypothetical protein HPB48_006236 [Haemaphysalis longicornis]|uniref:Uncharacterized protein n=1 Tax=Haemaphysalis longicornis TaxID=44386 RepID=A0A9J6GSU2_HAELO|nr:hypothetical protein HPB48_006236 [Haemaphysalis longicornis]